MATTNTSNTVDMLKVRMERYAPDGMTGSLTATRANDTMGVKNGNRDIQNALGVSGFLATVIMIKYPVMMRKINGN